MEDYVKCELINGGSPRYLNTFSNCLLLTVHMSIHARYCCYC